MPLRVCPRMAITAQQFCSIETAVNLFVSDGISKTAVWKKQDVLIKGTSQIRERSRYWHAGVDRGLRASFNHHSKQETQICASRRSPR
ncbi:hypothetical protein V1288_000283 [Bradyrhizobium sp. AZCC 2176]